jgi:glycosyltransferase involved in cell wall biosynthesis
LAVPTGVELVRLDDAGGGPARARAAGVAALDGCDWIALLDADDTWEPGKLAAQAAALAAAGADAPGSDDVAHGANAPGSADVAVCFGHALVVDARGAATGERLPEPPAGVHGASAFARVLYERNVIPASSVLVRRDALEAVAGFEPSEPLPAATDWDLWLRLVRAGFAFVCVPEARVRYRRHGGALTADISRLAEAGLAIHDRHAELVDPGTCRRARAQDLETLARGRIRERRYGDAQAALAEAAALVQPAARERMLRTAVAIPGVRGLLGRRDPFR